MVVSMAHQSLSSLSSPSPLHSNPTFAVSTDASTIVTGCDASVRTASVIVLWILSDAMVSSLPRSLVLEISVKDYFLPLLPEKVDML
jgi:hypothetical protein